MTKTYVLFEEAPRDPGRRTSIWLVSSTSGSDLGYISWFGRWRQYTFHPAPGTTYSAGCMDEIAAFIDQQMEARKLVPV